MSWTIHELRNTLKITDACAQELLACETLAQDFNWERVSDFTTKLKGGLRKPRFDPDNDEHMNWLGYPEAQAIVCKHKKGAAPASHGDVCFGNLEGDGAPSLWGYRFFVDGTMMHLKGKVSWKPVAVQDPA